MKTLILNCAILTSLGGFDYRKSSVEEAKKLLQENGFESAVGHKATAEILSQILDTEIPQNRIQAKQEAGQIAIVFSMNKRIEEGRILNREEIEEIGYLINILEKKGE